MWCGFTFSPFLQRKNAFPSQKWHLSESITFLQSAKVQFLCFLAQASPLLSGGYSKLEA